MQIFSKTFKKIIHVLHLITIKTINNEKSFARGHNTNTLFLCL